MKKVPVNLMLETIHLLNKCISFSLCLSGDRGLLFFPQKMKELSPLMGLRVLWLRAGLSLYWGIINLSCFSSSLYKPPTPTTKPIVYNEIQLWPFLQQENNYTYRHCAGRWDTGRKRVEMLSSEALQAGRAGAGIPKAWLSHSLLSFFKTCSRSSIAQLKTKQNKE